MLKTKDIYNLLNNYATEIYKKIIQYDQAIKLEQGMFCP